MKSRAVETMSPLHRLKRNDSKLSNLCIYADPTILKSERSQLRGCKLECCPFTIEEWKDIGRDVNNSTAVKKLHILGMREDLDPLLQENATTLTQIEKLREFFTMLDNNNTIVELLFYRLNFSNINMFETLSPMFHTDYHLVTLVLDQCELGQIGTRSLSSLLRRSHSIKHIYLSYNRIDDNSIDELVGAFSTLEALEALDLEGNRIGQHGCQAIATMLRNPKSELKRLGIQYNDIDDEGAAILLRSLERNDKLTHLDMELKQDYFKAKEALAKLICNPMSIHATYHSNHTLHFLGYYEVASRGSYLKLNEKSNKQLVARQKIHDIHFLANFRIAPFEDMNPTLLVRVLDFIDRARSENHYNMQTDIARHSLIFHLVKNTPASFCFK